MATYRLATYASADGPRAGMVVDDKVFDLAALTGNKAQLRCALLQLGDQLGQKGRIVLAVAVERRDDLSARRP